jgi:hypothetical protein
LSIRINFAPVGALPTDVAVTPDGKMAFVTSAEVNKPALYGVPTNELLGDSQGLPVNEAPPAARITSWPACSLPYAPISVTVVPQSEPLLGGAVGTADGGAILGAFPYQVVVVLPGDGDVAGQVLLIDPRPFLRGANVAFDGGVGDDTSAFAVGKGSLVPCTGKALNLSAVLPDVVRPGARWDDGVKYVDGGVDVAEATPSTGACRASASDGGVAASNDGGVSRSLAANRGVAHAAESVRDDQTLYVADSELPLIHVIDLSTPGTMRELSPLVATSDAEPSAAITIGALAVSPATRDYKRFLYAVDKRDGSIMVFDVTEAPTEPRFPMTRPHPELNPFQPVDRIDFGAPVATVAFVKNDFPLELEVKEAGAPIVIASGLLCNPNPNAGTNISEPLIDPGAYYRANFGGLGPYQLRGIFAFATLSNGQVIAIDVDDWDAPCRRPDEISNDLPASALAPGQPAPLPGDLDPYHAPFANLSAPVGQGSNVSQEAFFPVSAPHSRRSLYLLNGRSSERGRIPALYGVPTLTTTNNVLATTGPDSDRNPKMLPTRTRYADPTYASTPNTSDAGLGSDLAFLNKFAQPDDAGVPGVRLAWEEPRVHFDQTWTVAYEAALPAFDGVRTIAATSNDHQTVDLVSPDALFCRGGVEDYRLGKARVEAAISAAGSALSFPQRIDRHTADYIQITSEILPATDPYWLLDADASEPDSCWKESQSATSSSDPAGQAIQRQSSCLKTFGAATEQSIARDFPILEAYEKRLVIGRFGQPVGASSLTNANREVVAADNSNKSFLRAMRCCFNKQVAFRVRAGGEWAAYSNVVGYLHHIEASATPERACVQSCRSSKALLNSRTLEIPRPTKESPATFDAPDRNSPLAMRNPMFAFVMWAGVPPEQQAKTTSQRDYVWTFQTIGSFASFGVNLAPASNSGTPPVSPQSMRFIEILGKVAIIDGSSQGLVLVDLETVDRSGTLKTTRYF